MAPWSYTHYSVGSLDNSYTYLVAIRDNSRHSHTHGPVVPHEVVAHWDVLHVEGRLAM